VVLEAWAAGVPVVATASAGPAALIRDGETGLLVPIEDADALAAALRRVGEDRGLRTTLAAAGHAAFAAEFAAPRVVALYREFLAGVRR
jgi:glycosyltransferase involved in cell wall biosynthesis